MVDFEPRLACLSSLVLAVLLLAGCAGWHASQGDDAAAEGRWDEAVESYEKSLESEESPAVRRKLADAKAEAAAQHRRRGERALQSVKYSTAIRELRRSLLYEEDRRTKEMLRQARESKRLSEASQAVDAARTAESADELARARDAYQRALALDPGRAAAKKGLARVEREVDEAEAIAERAQRHLAAEDFQKALDLSEDALAVDAGNESAESIREAVLSERDAEEITRQARAAARSGGFPRAVDLMDRALAERGTPERIQLRSQFARGARELYEQKGDDARRRERWGEAIEQYERALGYAEDAASIREKMATVRYERALELAEEAEDGGDIVVALRHYRTANKITPSRELQAHIVRLEARQGQFRAGYEPPQHQAYAPLYDTFRRGQVLEKIANHLNQLLLLPQDITLWTRECGAENAFYGGGEIEMCYELIHGLARQFRGDPQADELFSGAFTFIFFHELGHALIDVYDLPITGREENVADQMAVAAMLEDDTQNLGDTAVVGAARWFYQGASRTPLNANVFADEHGLDQQRFYNVLCWLYGHDPARNQELVSLGYLPQRRAQRCPHEYQRIVDSWSTLLEDYLR